MPADVTFAEYVSADDDLIVSETLSDTEIVREVQAKQGGVAKVAEVVDDGDEGDDDTSEEPTIPSTRATVSALESIKAYMSSNDAGSESLDAIMRIEDLMSQLVIAGKKQRKITDIFKL